MDSGEERVVSREERVVSRVEGVGSGEGMEAGTVDTEGAVIEESVHPVNQEARDRCNTRDRKP